MNGRRRHLGRPGCPPCALVAAVALLIATACSYDSVTGPDAAADPRPEPDAVEPVKGPYDDLLENLLDRLGGSWSSFKFEERDGELFLTLTGFKMTSSPRNLALLFEEARESGTQPNADPEQEASPDSADGDRESPGPDLLPGPLLTLEDSVVLQENGGFFAGKPTALLPGPDDSHFVFDAQKARVLHFDRSGQPLGAYGRRGRGPGELTNPMGFAALVHDDILAVADEVPRVGMELEFFRIGSGRHLGSAPLAVEGVVTALATDGERLWAGGLNHDEWRALGSAPLAEALDFGGGEHQPAVALEHVEVPRIFVENRHVRRTGSLVVLDWGESDLLLSFRTHRHILRVGHDGQVLDTISMQPRNRRGVPEDEAFLEMATLPETASGEEIAELDRMLHRSVSHLLQLSRDAAGRIFMVHADLEPVGERDYEQVLHVSSIGGDGAQCSDTLVPTSGAGPAVAALRGSELLVLDRRLGPGGSGDARAVMRRFTIDPGQCTGEVEMAGRASSGALGQSAGHWRWRPYAHPC